MPSRLCSLLGLFCSQSGYVPRPAVFASYSVTTTFAPVHLQARWGPVAALITIPAAIAAWLLKKEKSAQVATAGLAASAILASGAPAYATMLEKEPAFGGLTPCAESKKFNKQLKKEVKSLEKRQKLYEEGSAPYLALEQTKVCTCSSTKTACTKTVCAVIPVFWFGFLSVSTFPRFPQVRTEKRFAKYAKSGLLCGTDGLPHLISDPGLAVKYVTRQLSIGGSEGWKLSIGFRSFETPVSFSDLFSCLLRFSSTGTVTLARHSFLPSASCTSLATLGPLAAPI